MLKKIGAIIIFVFCFLAAKFAVQVGMEKYNENKAINAIEETLIELEREAENNNTGLSKSEAIQEAAIKKSQENINSKSTPQKKKAAAISTFMGFYLVNFRTRSDYCETLKVSISTFTKNFEEIHREELQISRKVLFKDEKDIEKLYGLVKPQLEKVVAQDMDDIAAQYGVNTTGACQLVEDNGVTFAESMHVSKIQPTVYTEMHK